MVNFISRLSPKNCTECGSFKGNLVFRSDSEPQISHIEEVIWIDCEVRGKHFCNNSLWVCESFENDLSKRSLVVRDTSFKSYQYRIYRRAVNPGIDLENTIYDYVCKVIDLDPRGYLFNVAVHRVNKDLGISKEKVFRTLMDMVEMDYLVRVEIEGMAYLRPPSAVLSISDVLDLKRKVLA